MLFLLHYLCDGWSIIPWIQRQKTLGQIIQEQKRYLSLLKALVNEIEGECIEASVNSYEVTIRSSYQTYEDEAPTNIEDLQRILTDRLFRIVTRVNDEVAAAQKDHDRRVIFLQENMRGTLPVTAVQETLFDDPHQG